MTETDSEERNRLIEELAEVISRAENFLTEACEYYHWDIKDLETIAEHNYIICPFDKSHVVPERSMHKHLESCEWKKLGYTKDCKPLPESTIATESPCSIKFDMELQLKVLQEAKEKNPDFDIGTDEKLIPQTSDRLTSDFTRDERKAIYEYVVAHTHAPDLGQDITDLNKPEKKEERSASLLELLAQERNLKRRKTRYRGVHTNKKSHIEIMREVVQQQMDMYKEYLVEKYGTLIFNENQSNSSNNVEKEKHSSSHSEMSSSNHRSRDRSYDLHKSRDHSKNYKDNSKYHSSDSHTSHFYNDTTEENYKHYNSRDYGKSSRNPNQYEDRNYKSNSKNSSRRHEYRDKDENNYKSRERYEDKNYSRRQSDKRKADDTKEYRDKSKSSHIKDRNFSNWDKCYNMDDYNDNQYNSRDRKRDATSSVDKKHDAKSKDDSSSHKTDKIHEDCHKKKNYKSKSNAEKHKKSKHKHRSRSSSRN